MTRQIYPGFDVATVVHNALANFDSAAMVRGAAANLDTGTMMRKALANFDSAAMVRGAAANLDTGTMMRNALATLTASARQDVVDAATSADSTLTDFDVEAEIDRLASDLGICRAAGDGAEIDTAAEDLSNPTVLGNSSPSSSRLNRAQRRTVLLVLAVYLGTAIALHMANIASIENRVFDPHQLLTDQVQAVALALGALGPITWLQAPGRRDDD